MHYSNFIVPNIVAKFQLGHHSPVKTGKKWKLERAHIIFSFRPSDFDFNVSHLVLSQER